MINIQDLIDAAGDGQVINVPPAEYSLSTATPLRLKSNITLDLTGSTLFFEQPPERFFIGVAIDGCAQVQIVNGTITGAGIGIGGGSNGVQIHGTRIDRCSTDGLLIIGGKAIQIGGVTSSRNGRQGLSVTDVDGLLVNNSVFTGNGQTSDPGDGIDLECDLDSQRIANVLITKNVFSGNRGSCVGVGSPGTYSNIRIASNSFSGKQPIWVAGNAGSLGTPWWAYLLHTIFGGWRGYPTEWYKP